MNDQTHRAKRTDELLASARAISGLALALTEHLRNVQVDGAREYALAVLRSWRDALALTDLASVKQYVEQQSETAQELAWKLMSGAQLIRELGQFYVHEMGKVVTHSLAAATRRPA